VNCITDFGEFYSEMDGEILQCRLIASLIFLNFDIRHFSELFEIVNIC